MSRQAKIFILANFYPVFAACHLQFGGGSLVSTALFFIIPGTNIGYFFYIWRTTSHIKLARNESICIGYFIYFLLLLNGYYAICVIASKMPHAVEWIQQHNTYTTCFIIYTLAFYTYNFISERK